MTRSVANGPGIFVRDIHEHLLNKGFTSRIITIYNPEKLTGVIALKRHKTLYHKNILRFQKIIESITKKNRKLNWDYFPYSLNEQKEVFSTNNIVDSLPYVPDVVILYFIDGFINSKNIHELYKYTGANFLWYLPDMAAMTGGCHYAWDCQGYNSECGFCPAINSENKHDITFYNLKFKQKYLKTVPITIIAASSWLINRLRNSILFSDNRLEKIFISVRPDIFKPESGSTIKKHLGIPEESRTIFIAAQHLQQKRKGLSYFLESLKYLKDSLDNNSLGDIILLVAGNNDLMNEKQIPFKIKYIGYLDIHTELPAAFQAADFYVSSSIEDAGPMMINQALMSGTPIVAFDTGVAKDLVLHKKTGYLAKNKDILDFATGLHYFLNMDQAELLRYSENCRKLAMQLISPDIQIGNLISLFQH